MLPRDLFVCCEAYAVSLTHESSLKPCYFDGDPSVLLLFSPAESNIIEDAIYHLV
jgi:hypothetical protein